MPSPPVGAGTRNTRANMSMALLKTKVEEENKKQTASTVKDPISAANFLMDSDLKREDDELTFK